MSTAAALTQVQNQDQIALTGAAIKADFPIQQRRSEIEKIWGLSDEIVLINAGKPLSIPGGADQTFEFRVHPDFRWLAGYDEADCVLAYDPRAGWTEFVHQITDSERVWESDRPQRPGTPVSELSQWLQARQGRDIALLGAPLPGLSGDDTLASGLASKLLATRRPKDAVELRLMCEAIEATTQAFALAAQIIKPGISERAIQIEMEAEMFRRGADRTAYGTIVGSGSNSAVLHFKPGPRVVQGGDWVLIDAGAEINGYAADVTRMFPSDRAFSPKQQALYDVVLEAQKRAIDRCRPGVEWREVHESAARDMAAGLVKLGILKCSVDEAIESEAIALFFPHGIGHMVGLGVRDAGPYPGPANPARCCGVRLRVDFPLQSGFVMTIEPGLYFVPAVLKKDETRAKFENEVDWAVVDQWIDIGGVRIEDNVLVTDGDPVNLSAAIPK